MEIKFKMNKVDLFKMDLYNPRTTKLAGSSVVSRDIVVGWPVLICSSVGRSGAQQTPQRQLGATPVRLQTVHGGGGPAALHPRLPAHVPPPPLRPDPPETPPLTTHTYQPTSHTPSNSLQLSQSYIFF